MIQRYVISTGALLFCFVTTFQTSCDYIDLPHEGGGTIDTTGTETQYNDTTRAAVKGYRSIVLEDYTGHTCGNCPYAAKESSELHGLFGDTLLIAAIHAGGFATPEPGTGKFEADYRTEAGTAYDQHFDVGSLGYPNGIINRIGFPDNILYLFQTWEGRITSLINSPGFEDPEFSIALENIYNTKSRNSELHITAKAEKQVPGQRNILIWALESGIVSWQRDYSKPTPEQDIPNYTHNHVLRKAIPGTWGDILSTDPLGLLQTVEKKFTFAIDPAWKAENVSLLVLIYDPVNYEIVQAAEIEVGN